MLNENLGVKVERTRHNIFCAAWLVEDVAQPHKETVVCVISCDMSIDPYQRL